MGRKPDTRHPSPQRVLVLGGGLAGISAACDLLDSGYQVVLIEKRPFLGGRAYSFLDRETGWEVDNGQHVFMGCCTHYIAFLKKIDAYQKAFLQDTLKVRVLSHSREGTLSSTPILGSLHLLPSLLKYPHLSFVDKFLALYALLRMKFTNRHASKDLLDSESFYSWLKRHYQTERAIKNLWNLIVLPTLNDDVQSVSAHMALMIFQEGLLRSPAEATVGFSKVGLSSLAGESARSYIESHGGTLLLGKTVTTLKIQDGLVTGVETLSGELLQGDSYVSALPFDVLLDVLPAEVSRDPFFARASGLQSSPIVGIHIWYDRPVMEGDFVAFLDSPVQWVFNKSLIQGLDGYPGQYLCISLSGAWEYINRPKEELRELFAREMETLFPKACNARIEKFLVVKQPQATFRSAPGADQHRLPQKTPIANLFLAGEWTDTGWPSTMEGAVRSGSMAAQEVASRS